MSGSRLPLCLLLALSVAGCGKLREISACRAVARDVNASVDEIEALSKAKPVDETRIAKRYASLAQTLKPRAQGESALALAVRDYSGVLLATDAALRNHAAGLGSGGKASEARRELERLLKREHAAATRINVECER